MRKFTEEMDEIDSYLKENKLGYVGFLPCFNDDDALQIVVECDLVITIERGDDDFIIGCGQNAKWSRRDLWYACNDGKLIINKGFKCYKKAITEAIKYVRKDLQSQIDSLPDISRL